ncbi:MAG: hypothetical protein IMX03_07430 [Brockia lithotrophica]|nr:hypothetical protein [Brockia lithotrophica]
MLRAYTWRTWREGGRTLLIISLLFSVLLVAVVLMIFYIPNLLTSSTRQSLEFYSRHYFGSLPDSRLAWAAAFLIIEGPFLVAVFTSFTAANIPLNIIGGEINRGTMELLLAAPIRLRTLVLAMLAASLSFAVASWAVLSFVTLVLSFFTLWGMGVSQLMPEPTYWESAFLLPLSLAVLAGLLSVLLLLLFPSLARFRTGMLVTQNPVVVIAVSPALFSLLAIVLRPDVSPARVASFAIVGSLILSGLLVLVAPLLVRGETLLYEE